jgi:hypothetical protein
VTAIPWQASDEDDGHHVAPLRQSRSVGHRHLPLSLAPHDVPSLALVACLGLTQIQLGREREREIGAPERSPSTEPGATSARACADERVLHDYHWGEWRGRELRERRPQWPGSGGENDSVQDFI